MKRIFLIVVLLLLALLKANAQRHLDLTSPDGKIKVDVYIGTTITYAVTHQADTILSPSTIALRLDNGEILGGQPQIKSLNRAHINRLLTAAIYKRSSVPDNYSELKIDFKKDFCVVFRVYDQGVAYRFITTKIKPFTVVNEEAVFAFPQNNKSVFSYVRENRPSYAEQFQNSYENLYTFGNLSAVDSKRLMVLPLLVEATGGKKVCITEADLEDYPGMYLTKQAPANELKGVFAPYPAKTEQGGHINAQLLVTEREPYIAKCNGNKSFPWRVMAIAVDDKELADNDLVYLLASPSRIADASWIKPGKVAWDWWNDWNLYGVNFKAGVNTATYKYYIDFAAAHQIQYVILDEGWSVKREADLFKVIPDIDIQELVTYGRQKQVGIILWAGYYAFARDMENVCSHYSSMGIKGFKIDFIERDDQQAVEFYYRAAQVAAKNKLLLSFHGAYKPTGLQRTYPNVLNFEAVFGMEQMKAPVDDLDMVKHDVTIPFIRMLAGPMDYTQGAMRNATKKGFYASNSDPMSQGTRCRQLAEYVIFESPLAMLCDNPKHYELEKECTQFISAIPTVWDKTIVLDGKVGEHIAIARKKADTWYIGALTNWTARTIMLDVSFLDNADYQIELFKDGLNAGKAPQDYQREIVNVGKNRKITLSMAPGGGWVARFVKK